MKLCIFNLGPVWHAKDAAIPEATPHPLSTGWRSQRDATRGIIEAFRAAGLPDPEHMTGRVDKATARELGIHPQNNKSEQPHFARKKQLKQLGERRTPEWRPGDPHP